MSSGQDVRFNEEKVSQGQQLTNKLWNASRLILLRVDSEHARRRPPADAGGSLDPFATRALARRRGARRSMSSSSQRPSLALYDFIYGELCDWYLELVKPRLYDGDEDTAATLLHVLTETLTFAHPLIPFVTEEIYRLRPGLRRVCSQPASPLLTRAASTRTRRRRSSARSQQSRRSAPGATRPT